MRTSYRSYIIYLQLFLLLQYSPTWQQCPTTRRGMISKEHCCQNFIENKQQPMTTLLLSWTCPWPPPKPMPWSHPPKQIFQIFSPSHCLSTNPLGSQLLFLKTDRASAMILSCSTPLPSIISLSSSFLVASTRSQSNPHPAISPFSLHHWPLLVEGGMFFIYGGHSKCNDLL